MPGLIASLVEGMRHLLNLPEYTTHAGLQRLVNDVVNDDTDYEQLITFLGDARSATYQRFAEALRVNFSTVLRSRLDRVEAELGANQSDLYAALVDMHNVPKVGEDLIGFLTINYDGLLEHAIEKHLGGSVDYGISVHPPSRDDRSIPVLKLHGSFSWSDDWPVKWGSSHNDALWIPPGIRKAKGEYPFNTIWGLARELLECDVLRIIGCNLGPNDWDLVSMLFATMHTHASKGPYRIEIITRPMTAAHIQELFPYLNVFSILEVPDIGRQIVGELRGSVPVDFTDLSGEERQQVVTKAQGIGNPFEYWLRVKGESLNEDLESIDTPAGLFKRFIEG